MSHGNSKDSSSKLYIRTWASTKESVRNASELVQPRDSVHIVDDLGGIAACSSVGQIPRGQQVKDLGKSARKKELKKHCLLIVCKTILGFAFLEKARNRPRTGKQLSSDASLCVMTTERQPNNLKRFCCNPTEFRPFTVDLTFDIGKYNVTPITYQHLLLENNRDSKHPSFIGPVLLHEMKITETYMTFGASLKTLKPELHDVMAFGTNDEQALVYGFKNNFEPSVHLLCELHLKKNIESKLQELERRNKMQGNRRHFWRII